MRDNGQRARDRFDSWLEVNGIAGQHTDEHLTMWLYTLYRDNGLAHGGLKNLRAGVQRTLGGPLPSDGQGRRPSSRLLAAVRRTTSPTARRSEALSADDVLDLVARLHADVRAARNLPILVTVEEAIRLAVPASQLRKVMLADVDFTAGTAQIGGAIHSMGSQWLQLAAERCEAAKLLTHTHAMQPHAQAWARAVERAPDLFRRLEEGRPLSGQDKRSAVGLCTPEGARALLWSAYLLVGWLTGSRHADLLAMTVDSVKVNADHVEVKQYGSKTDPDRRSTVVHRLEHLEEHERPELCPACALVSWAEALKAGLNHSRGTLFPQWFGWSTSRGKPLSRHTARSFLSNLWHDARGEHRGTHAVGTRGLRVGHTTALDASGFELDEIAEMTGRRSVDEIVRYVRARPPTIGV